MFKEEDERYNGRANYGHFFREFISSPFLETPSRRFIRLALRPTGRYNMLIITIKYGTYTRLRTLNVQIWGCYWRLLPDLHFSLLLLSFLIIIIVIVMLLLLLVVVMMLAKPSFIFALSSPITSFIVPFITLLPYFLARPSLFPAPPRPRLLLLHQPFVSSAITIIPANPLAPPPTCCSCLLSSSAPANWG